MSRVVQRPIQGVRTSVSFPNEMSTETTIRSALSGAVGALHFPAIQEHTGLSRDQVAAALALMRATGEVILTPSGYRIAR